MNSLAPCPLQHFLAPRGCFRTATKHGSVFWESWGAAVTASPTLTRLPGLARGDLLLALCWQGSKSKLPRRTQDASATTQSATSSRCNRSPGSLLSLTQLNPLCSHPPSRALSKGVKYEFELLFTLQPWRMFPQFSHYLLSQWNFPFLEAEYKPSSGSLSLERGRLIFCFYFSWPFLCFSAFKKSQQGKDTYLPKGVMLEGIQISKTSQPASTLETQNHQKVGGSWIKFISKLYSLWPRNKHCCG